MIILNFDAGDFIRFTMFITFGAVPQERIVAFFYTVHLHKRLKRDVECMMCMSVCFELLGYVLPKVSKIG